MIRQLNLLRKLFVFQGAFVFALWLCTSASASVIDSPHNETHDVKCGDCHAYSLWWQYSPAANNSSVPYGQITDGVCNKCHAPGESAPNKIPHSWGSMLDIHDTYLGTWETKCLDCHNPHYQDQLNWQGSNSADLFLVTGTINAGSLQVDSGTNTTTLTYKNADAHANWTDPALWSQKSTDGRGLILVISDVAQNTFEINDASQLVAIVPGSANGTGTITLQGSLPTSYNSADTNFTVIYGQLVKKSIATPVSGAKDVKFFDASLTYDSDLVGGTADKTADPIANPPEGICQVCHTKTKYYNNDGLQPDRNDPTGTTRIAALSHNGSSPCTGCHAIAVGFRPTNADHTFISNMGTTCATCHNQADIITGTHKGNCVDCHPSAPPALAEPFPSPKWPTAQGQARATGTCYDCHSPIAAAFAAHPKALDHSGQVDAYNNCVSCHFHSNKDIVTEIHGPDGSPCDTCHNLTYNAGAGTYSGSGALISRAAQYGKGNCTKCHPDIASNFFVHPNSGNHAGQVDATPQCVVCHNGDPVDDVHSWSCGMCHTAPTGRLKSVALTKGPGDCMNCHTDFYIHATTTPHTTEVSATASCVVCHSNADLINGLHGTNGCATCHDQYGTLLGSAAGHPGGGSCAVCHTTQAAGPHPQINHMATTYVTANPEGNCTSCHSGDTVEVVHNGNCLGCHAGLSTELIHTLIGSAAGHVGHANNTCTECHTAIAGSFTKHANTYTHNLQVTALGTGCFRTAECHVGDPIDGLDTHNMDCDLCHEPTGADRRLIGSAAGKGTGKPPTTGNNCSACHVGAQYNTDPQPGATSH